MALHAHEVVALGYLGYLLVLGLARTGRTRFAPIATTWGTVMSAFAVLLLAGVGNVPIVPSHAASGSLRDWAPPLFIVVGYWLPAQLVSGIDVRFEHWLRELDDRAIRGLLDRATRAPRVATEILELAYLCCYPMIPAGFGLLVVAGASGESERYWTALLIAAALSYGSLPLAPTRPPRELEPERRLPPSTIRRLNLIVLGHASVQLNTFPSGHVATSVAASLAVFSRWPEAGLALGALAALIAVASVVRRYHYALDAVTGIIVGVVAFAVSRLA